MIKTNNLIVPPKKWYRSNKKLNIFLENKTHKKGRNKQTNKQTKNTNKQKTPDNGTEQTKKQNLIANNDKETS